MPTILYWTNSDTNGLEFFQLDVATSLDHNDSASIADHPVEQGADITDHARDDPELLSIEGMITNTPHAGNLTSEDSYSDQPLALTVHTRNQSGTKKLNLDVPSPSLSPTVDSLVGAGLGALGKAFFGGPTAEMNNPTTAGTKSVTVSIPQPDSPRNRARDGYEKLLGAKLARELIVVETPMRSYFDMMIARIEVPVVAEDGQSVKFQIDLRRIRIAGSDTVAAPSPAEARGNPSKSLGAQAAKPKEEAPAAESESLLHKGLLGS
jgi:hypothetical protein